MGIFTIIFSSICSIDGIGAVASSRAARWTPEQVRGDGRVWGLRNRTRRVRGDERLFEEGGGDDRGGADVGDRDGDEHAAAGGILDLDQIAGAEVLDRDEPDQIGRASWRERECQYV